MNTNTMWNIAGIYSPAGGVFMEGRSFPVEPDMEVFTPADILRLTPRNDIQTQPIGG
jgi:hypothetical protein